MGVGLNDRHGLAGRSRRPVQKALLFGRRCRKRRKRHPLRRMVLRLSRRRRAPLPSRRSRRRRSPRVPSRYSKRSSSLRPVKPRWRARRLRHSPPARQFLQISQCLGRGPPLSPHQSPRRCCRGLRERRYRRRGHPYHLTNHLINACLCGESHKRSGSAQEIQFRIAHRRLTRPLTWIWSPAD